MRKINVESRTRHLYCQLPIASIPKLYKVILATMNNIIFKTLIDLLFDREVSRRNNIKD